MELQNIIGWLFMLLSWFSRYFFKEKLVKDLISVALSAIAVGIFLCMLITEIIKD
jgi:hypothetical protein